MISTPGHRSSIYVTSRSFGTHYTLGSDTTIENAAHWRPERFRIRSSRGGRPYRGGPRVRIHLPPAASRVRTRFQDHGWRRRARIQRGCAGFQLDRVGAVRVARFVCSDSSAASASGGTSGSNAPTLSCCSEDPAGCAATRLGSYGRGLPRRLRRCGGQLASGARLLGGFSAPQPRLRRDRRLLPRPERDRFVSRLPA